MNVRSLVVGAAAALLMTGLPAVAAPIVPAYDSFGTLTGATFGGSGIPNHAVAVSHSGGDLTLGLTAHQRFVGPNLANDGAGTFTAYTGNSNTPADPYATWNFGFYAGGGDVSDSLFALFYDFDPAADTDEAVHGIVGIAGISFPSNPFQDSWNLGMNFLATTSAPLGISAPSFAPFNPMVAGEYTFALVGYSSNGDELARAAIRVNVIDPQRVPEPGSLVLLGTVALLAFGVRRRRG